MANKPDSISSAATSNNDEVAGELFSNRIAKESPLEDKAFNTAKTRAASTGSRPNTLPWRTLLIIATALVLGGLLLLLSWMYVAGKNQKQRNLANQFNTTPLDLGSLKSNTLGNGNTVLLNGALTVNGPVTAQSFSGNGANLSDVDAVKLNHQPGSFYQDASNINAGTLSDARLSPNVVLLGSSPYFAALTVNGTTTLNGQTYSWPSTQAAGSLANDGAGNLTWVAAGACPTCTTQGNTFNGPNQLVQLDGLGYLPALNGSNLTDLNASNISTGTLSDARLSANVTLMGNTFNGANQLVELNGLGFLPSLNGSNLNSLNASNIGSGTLSDARLSANVAFLNVAQTYTGANSFTPNQTFNGGITTNNITPTSTLTVGSTSHNLTLQGDGTVTLSTTTGGFTTTMGFSGVPVGNVTYEFDRAAPAGTYTICTSVGNCPGAPGSVSTLGGTTNKIAKFSGAFSIADSSLSDTGSNVSLQPSSDTTSTFAVLDSTGLATILSVDSTNKRVGVNNAAPSYPLDVTGDVNSSTGLRVGGTLVCDNTGCTAAGGGGNYIQNTTGTQSNANFNFQSANASYIGGVIKGAASQTANLQEWQNSGAVALAYVDASGNISTSGQFQVNGTQINSSDLSDGSNLAKLNGTGPQIFTGNNKFTGNTLTFQPAADSLNALQVFASGGGTAILNADTTNARIGINNDTPGYALDVNGDINSSSALRVGGTTVCTISGCTAAGGSGSYIRNGTALQTTANFNIQSAAAGSIGAVIRGAASQTANLQEWQNSGGTALVSVGSAGTLTLASGVAFNMSNATATLTSSNLQITGTGAILIGATPASAGAIRLTNNTAISFRNGANSGDINAVKLDASDNLLLNGGNGATGVVALQNNGVSYLTVGSSAASRVNIATGNAFLSDFVRVSATTGSLGTVEKFRVNTPTTTDNSANAIFSTSATTSKGLVVQGIASQSANLTEWQNSGGTVLSAHDASGNLVFGASASSSTGVIRLQNATSIGWRNAGNTADKIIKLSSANVTDALDLPGNIVVGGSDATAGAVYFFNSAVVAKRTGASGLQLLTAGTNGIVLNQSGQVGINPGSSTFTGGTVELLRVKDPTTADNLANVIFTASATTSKPLVIQGLASQTANLTEWQSSTGAALAAITSGGDLTFGTGATHTISLATSTTGTGNTLAITGAAGLAAGNNAGGQVTLTGGTGSSSTGLNFGGAGGAVTIAGGTTNATDWQGNVGGALNLNGGSPASSVVATNATGGAVNINGGTGGSATGFASSGAAAGGAVVITSGSGGAAAGGGNQTGGAGAGITLTAGSGGVSIGTAANSNGGGITLTAGSAGTGGSGAAGTAGTISIQGVSGSAINIGTTAVAQTISIGNTTGATTTNLSAGTGGIVLNTISAADNATYLCRNSSNQIATCSGGASGSAFVNGGNSFGATANLGTNDTNDLAIRTNGITRVTVPNGVDGFTFGSAGDTNLYRSAANVLKTDNSLHIVTKQQIGTDANVSTIDQCNALLAFIPCTTNFETVTASTDTTNNTYGINNIASISPTATNTAGNRGSVNILALAGSQSFTGTNYGIESNTINVSTATVSQLVGIVSNVLHSSSGTLTEGIGIRAGITQSAGTFTTGTGLQIASATGAIGANYGINVKAQTAGTADYGIAIEGADTQTLWVSSNADNTSAAAGIAFGLNRDTNLYRSAADTLKTDDSFTAGTVFFADAANGRVGIGATNPGGTKLYTTSTSSTQIVGILRGVSGQTANLQEWQNNTGTQLAAVDASGRFVATTLGSADNATYLCRNSSNQIATCSGGASGSAFVNGGNSFGSAATLGTNDNNSLSINTGTGALNVGTDAAAKAVAVGNTTGATSLALNAGTGGLTIQTQGTGTLGIGNNAVAQTLAIGNSTGATSLAIAAGTGGLTIQTQGTGTLGIGNNALAQTLAIGNSTGATSVAIAAGTGGLTIQTQGTGTLGIGNNAVAQTIVIGNQTGATAVTIDSGTGAMNIGTAIAKTITIGNGTGATSVVLNSGTGAINIGTNAVAHTITLGNSTGATSVVLNSGTGAINIGTNAVAHTITVGNVTGATALTLQTGTGALNLQTQGTNGINIGTNAVAQPITIGNSTGATAVSVNCGTGTCGFGNNAVDHSSTVGSATGTSVLTLQAGTGGTVLSTGGTVRETFDNANNVIFGNGITNASPSNFTINGTGGSGANIAGANLTFAAGISTGSANGGALNFQTSKASGSSSTLNTLSTVFSLSGGIGAATFKNTTNGTGAFIVTDSTATNNVLNVDTTNDRVAIGTGTANPTVTLDVLSAGADGSTVAQFKNAGATNCTVQPGGTGFACSSDARLKTNIMNLTSTDATDIVSKLQGVSFNWITNPDGQAQVGFIAQDLMKYIPSAVSTDSTGHYVANYTAIIPYLVEAFKKQQTQIDTLSSQTGTSVDVLKELADAKAVTLSGDLIVGGNVVVSGHLAVGKDGAGSATLPAGQTSVHVSFQTPYKKAPKVTVSVNGDPLDGGYSVKNVTISGFDIVIKPAQPENTVFDWNAVESQ